LLETAALAAPTLAALLPDRAAAAALAALVEDDVSFAVGGVDVTVDGVVSPTAVSADGTLRTPRVVGARDAAIALLACRDADSGWQLHAVPADSCTVYPTPALSSSRDLSTVHWPLDSETLLAYGVAAEAAVSLLADRAAAGSAALLVGLADRMLAMTATYAKERHQFGKAIGSFQAVKHQLANARVALEFARPATYRAAWSLATAQPTLSHDASMAKAMASDAADLAARVGLQVHLGMRPPLLLEAHLGVVAGMGRRRHPPPAGPGPGPTGGEGHPDGNVRFPPVIVAAACHAGTRDRGPGPLLPGGAEQGRPLRRLVLLRGDLHRDLLPPELPGPHPEAAERPLLRHRGRRPAGRVPRLPPLPARRHAGIAGMERAGRRRGAVDAPHP
jgi:hypothetical protein